MRGVTGRWAVVLALAVNGCASSGTGGGPAAAPDLPPSVGQGLGSQYGNYPATAVGDMTGPAGEHCVLFDWDRPLTRDLAVRLRSASCDAPDHPGWMVSREISRSIIPIADSHLAQPAEPVGSAVPER